MPLNLICKINIRETVSFAHKINISEIDIM